MKKISMLILFFIINNCCITSINYKKGFTLEPIGKKIPIARHPNLIRTLKNRYEIEYKEYSGDSFSINTNSIDLPLLSTYSIIPIPVFLVTLPLLPFTFKKCTTDSIELVFKVREFDYGTKTLYSKYEINPKEIFIEDENRNIFYADSIEEYRYNKIIKENEYSEDVIYSINIPISCQKLNNSILSINGIYSVDKNSKKTNFSLGKYKVKHKRELYFFFFGA